MNNDDISHFSTIPASFAIKSNVYFITHQYLIINNSQSQRALSVSVRTVLWIYFASRRNCGLLPYGITTTADNSVNTLVYSDSITNYRMAMPISSSIES